MRCFIAIDMPQEVKEELEKIQNQIKSSEIKAKWVKPELFHLTLYFIGEINDFKVNQIKELLKQIKTKIKSFEAKLNNLGFFTSKNFIRVLWIGVEPNEKFKQLYEVINKELKKIKINSHEKFESHITLARIKWLKDKKAFIEKIKKIKPKEINFIINEIKLKKSILTKEGPIYEDIYILKLNN